MGCLLWIIVLFLLCLGLYGWPPLLFIVLAAVVGFIYAIKSEGKERRTNSYPLQKAKNRKPKTKSNNKEFISDITSKSQGGLSTSINELDKAKDYILKLAYEKGEICYSLYSKDDIQLLKYVIDIVKNDGYIECFYYSVGICFNILPKGRLFMLQGGYSLLCTEEREMTSNNFFSRIDIEAAKRIVEEKESYCYPQQGK